MQTKFTKEQLNDPATAHSNKILRACVHCGLCTATCPTYQILGDELDSPRGRIYLIKDMLENNRIPDAKTVRHIDRCLSCLSCMSTCPSGVHYMHLIDHARVYINQHYKRRLDDRLFRWVLGKILPYPNRFRWALIGAKLLAPFARFMPDRRLRAMLELRPKKLVAPSANDAPQVFSVKKSHMRVALMTGCAQQAINTAINDATIRILQRHGVEVVVAQGAGCCGALNHHMGDSTAAHKLAFCNIKAWQHEIKGAGLDAIVINTSGCGTTVKDYGHMFAQTNNAAAAQQVADLTCDISEVLARLDLRFVDLPKLNVAYHAACSLQHGQKIKNTPKVLLSAAGFSVFEPAESHLCCGSAGTYNLLQPEIAQQLKARKLANIAVLKPDVIAAGNIGCITQIGNGADAPIVHTVELLDWATGGVRPSGI